mgnify:CR=1 FL=1
MRVVDAIDFVRLGQRCEPRLGVTVPAGSAPAVLEALLAELGLSGAKESEKAHLNDAWHRLKPASVRFEMYRLNAF